MYEEDEVTDFIEPSELVSELSGNGSGYLMEVVSDDSGEFVGVEGGMFEKPYVGTYGFGESAEIEETLGDNYDPDHSIEIENRGGDKLVVYADNHNFCAYDEQTEVMVKYPNQSELIVKIADFIENPTN